MFYVLTLNITLYGSHVHGVTESKEVAAAWREKNLSHGSIEFSAPFELIGSTAGIRRIA